MTRSRWMTDDEHATEALGTAKPPGLDDEQIQTLASYGRSLDAYAVLIGALGLVPAVVALAAQWGPSWLAAGLSGAVAGAALRLAWGMVQWPRA